MSFELLVTYSGTDRPSDQNETTFPIMHCASQLFIHSGYFYFFFKSTILRGAPDTAWILSKFHPKAPQATASEGLSQGPYVAAGAGFQPATLRTKGDESTNEPPR